MPLGIAFGVVNVQYALVLLLVSYGYAIFVTLAAMCAEEWAFHRYDAVARPGRRRSAAAVFENLGYRQMTVLWRLEGLVGQPARQGAGVGRDDPRGFEEEARRRDACRSSSGCVRGEAADQRLAGSATSCGPR